METTQHLSKIHIMAITTLAIIFLSPLAQSDIGIGAIVIDSQIEGKGDFETNGGINVGDIITTGPKGNITILFDDESMLTLGPNAKAQVVKYSETPAPGFSEIKIISGGFRYFPGIILENGGQQLLNNIGGQRTSDTNTNTDSDLALRPIDQPLDDNLSAINEQLNNISLIRSTSIQSSAAGTGGSGAGRGGGAAAGGLAPGE